MKVYKDLLNKMNIVPREQNPYLKFLKIWVLISLLSAALYLLNTVFNFI